MNDRILGLFSFVLLGLAFPGSGGAVPIYEITEIGAVGYTKSSGRALNSFGHVVGTVWGANEEQGRAFIYANGTVTVLGTLGGTSSQGFGVNDGGFVVGTSRTAADQRRAFRYDGATMIDLGTLGGNFSTASGINNAGQIVGAAATVGGDGHAFRWEGGSMSDLGTLGGDTSSAFAINQAGDVVGHSGVISDPYTHTFLYSGAVMSDVGTRETPAFNDIGQITGGSYSGFGPSVAFLYEGGVTASLGTLGGDSSRGRGINNLSQIVGEADNLADESRAFIFEGGAMFDLNSFLAPYAGSPWVLRTAYAINDNGWITGVGERDGVERAYLLRPIPEPTTWLLLVGGLLLMVPKLHQAAHCRRSLPMP